jgi:regulator of protease activity HflC (stomatin/prohibitin superfamily)
MSIGVRIVRQYERGVVFRFGKLRGLKPPGIAFMLPFVDSVRLVDMRTFTLPIEAQQAITRDNVSIGVAAVAYYRRVDPVKSLIEIENVEVAIYQIAQTTLRNMVGQHHLDEVLSNTTEINQAILDVLEHTALNWGVEVQRVELKDIELPESMQRAMARQAEAEREKRARIIDAEGEALSVGKLAEAAEIIAAHPIALQLRNLQVLAEVAADQNSTIIFPAEFMSSIRSVVNFVQHEQSTDTTQNEKTSP